MVSKAEAKRRRQQSVRDKARHREELEEQEKERRRRQSQRDRARHYASQDRPIRLPALSSFFRQRAAPAEDTESLTPETPVIQSKIVPGKPEEMGTLPVDKEFFGQFCDQTARMFNNPKLADGQVSIGTVDFPIHRFVLCLQSEYFANALDGAYVEGTTKTLRCPDQKEHAYLRLLQYLYTGDYDEEPSSLIAVEDDDELLKHPQVYFLADSFGLGSLKNSALDKFESKLDDLWLSEKLVDCIEEVYSNTSSGVEDPMRRAIIDTCVARVTQLLLGKAFLALVEKGGDFAIDLIRALADGQGQPKDRVGY